MTALSMATTAHTATHPPRSCRRVQDSRKADKFVLTTHSTIIDALDEIARSHSRSINSEIIMAVAEALDGSQRTAFERQLYLNSDGKRHRLRSLHTIGFEDWKYSLRKREHTPTLPKAQAINLEWPGAMNH